MLSEYTLRKIYYYGLVIPLLLALIQFITHARIMCDDEMGFKVDGHLRHVGATDIYPNHTVPGRASKAINQYSVHIASN